MKIKNLLFIFVISFLFSCKTIIVTNKETTSKIMFKNLMKESQKIEYASFSGSFKVTGVKDVPSAYISFKTDVIFNEKKALFSISILRKPILEILFNNNNGILLNHTKKEFVRFNLEEIDYSKIMGINFNPFEISYLFAGCVPYSDDMQLMDFKWTKKEYIITLTNNISKYEIYLDPDYKIVKATINNQFFDKIILESIKYSKNDDNKDVPNILNFSSEDQKYKLSFLIEKSSLKKVEIKDITKDNLEDWKEVEKIEDIEVKIR